MSDSRFYFVDLLRHGEAEGGAIFRGDRDDPLTVRGLHAMQAAANDIPSVATVCSSPKLRCAQFAQTFSATRGSALLVDDNLREYSFGTWEGHAVEDIYREQQQALENFWRDPQRYPPPGAESFETFVARLRQAWASIVQHARNGHVLIVTHGGPIRILLCLALGWPLSSCQVLEVAHASHTRLRVASDGQALHVSLVFFNRSPARP